MPDGYDYLMNMAMLDGVRIAPLFMVFFNLENPVKDWKVCSTDIQGDPVRTESEHFSLNEALAEAKRLNELAGLKVPPQHTDKRNVQISKRQGGR